MGLPSSHDIKFNDTLALPSACSHLNPTSFISSEADQKIQVRDCLHQWYIFCV